MNRKPALQLAIALWVVCVMFAVTLLILQLRYSPNGEGTVIFVAYVFYVALLLAFSTLGTLIVARRPENVIGWILCAIGFISIGLEEFPDLYARISIDGSRSLPGDAWAAWVASWSESLGIGLMLTFMLLLFPTGRLPSPRWRMVAWLGAAWIGLLCVTRAFMPGELYIYEPLQNPVRLEPLQGVLATARVVAEFGYLVVPVLSITSIVVRARHAHSREKQQLKWFTFNAMLIMLGMLIAITGEVFELESEMELTWVPLALALSSTPLIIAMAILRYRLYDIDRLISRTIAWSSLTAVLLAIFFTAVLLLGGVARTLTGESSDLVTAGSTLLVAGLVQPLRRRIQTIVDHHFNRHGYDAARTLEAFSGRLRDEIDLDALSSELRAVVHETMQPAHVSIWLPASPKHRPVSAP